MSYTPRRSEQDTYINSRLVFGPDEARLVSILGQETLDAGG